jgi:hypothetical protein
MFPVSDPSLTFGEISDYWSREIRPSASKEELLNALECAWWLGEIHGTPGNPDFSRLNLLKKIFHWLRDKDDLGIEFVFEEDRAKPRFKMQTDGSAIIDRRHPVYLPSPNPDDWNEDLCKDAFRALAETSSTNSYPELVAIFRLIKLSYPDFFGWIAKRGYAKPGFWRRPSERPSEKTRSRAKSMHSGGGVKARAIKRAIDALWPKGIPDGLSGKERNKAIIDWMKRNGCSIPAAPERAIQRELKERRSK